MDLARPRVTAATSSLIVALSPLPPSPFGHVFAFFRIPPLTVAERGGGGGGDNGGGGGGGDGGDGGSI